MAADLRTHCDCGVRVRILWSEPLGGPQSRPVLLVCGRHHRECEFRQVIPEDAVNRTS